MKCKEVYTEIEDMLMEGDPLIGAILYNAQSSNIPPQEVVDASDITLEIPQFGTKHSLNVSVSVGVVLWHITAGRLGTKIR